MVDGTGRRFVDEAQNYGDVGRAMARATGPWWLVFDATCRRRYPVGPLGPGDPDPPWLRRADDLDALAGAIGVPADTLGGHGGRLQRRRPPGRGRGVRPGIASPTTSGSVTPRPPIRRWPPRAGPPSTPFRSISAAWVRRAAPAPTTGVGCLAGDGSPVAGLYAAGNVAANPFGTATPAGGGTLGPALVFGFRAGEAAAGDR